jgi:polyisoprenyl-phosphate glycosyltransferase
MGLDITSYAELPADVEISCVIPCFNEEKNIVPLYQHLTDILKAYPSCEILFVDDGSRDGTLAAIEGLAAGDPRVKYISFSRNFGHQCAVRAGLEHARGACVISLDADLQHPPALIPRLIEKWKEGYQVVYTRRRDVAAGSWFKKTSSRWFYRVLNFLSDLRLEEGTADFRLLDRKVIGVLRAHPETPLFLRGFVSNVGFRQIGLDYVPAARFAEGSKYSFKKMLVLALDGITSYSTRPLHLATLLGFLITLLALVYILFAVSMFFFSNKTLPGWTSVLVSVLFLGGIQLLMLGIIGEYLGKLFMQSKGRPAYIVDRTNV